MNNLFLLLWLACGLIDSGSEQQRTIWQGRNSKKKVFIQFQLAKKDSVSVPFIWRGISNDILNEMIVSGSAYDSLLNRYEIGASSDLPESVVSQSSDLTFLYTGKKVFKIDSCPYQVYSFILNENAEINENDCYEFYYIKGVGIIECLHKDNEVPSFSWDKFTLKDIKNNKDKSIINETQLKEIILNLDNK